MRYYCHVVLLLVLCSLSKAISAQSPETMRTETHLYECFLQGLKNHVDHPEEFLRSLENTLIEHHILNGDLPEDYKSALAQIAKQEGVIEVTEALTKALNELPLIPYQIGCRDTSHLSRMDSIELLQSKIVHIIRATDSILHLDEITPAVFLSTYNHILHREDFEHPFYRTFIVVMLSNLLHMQNDLLQHEKNYAQQSRTESLTDAHNLILVYLNENDDIFIDNRPMLISEVRGFVEHFLENTADWDDIELPLLGQQKQCKGGIIFTCERGTSYALYIEVQNELRAAFQKLRNDLAQQHFQEGIDELSEEQYNEIRQLLPLRLMETEPLDRISK